MNVTGHQDADCPHCGHPLTRELYCAVCHLSHDRDYLPVRWGAD